MAANTAPISPASSPRALTTTGMGGLAGFTNVAHWYAEPIVFEKVVLFTMLFVGGRQGAANTVATLRNARTRGFSLHYCGEAVSSYAAQTCRYAFLH